MCEAYTQMSQYDPRKLESIISASYALARINKRAITIELTTFPHGRVELRAPLENGEEVKVYQVEQFIHPDRIEPAYQTIFEFICGEPI